MKNHFIILNKLKLMEVSEINKIDPSYCMQITGNDTIKVRDLFPNTKPVKTFYPKLMEVSDINKINPLYCMEITGHDTIKVRDLFTNNKPIKSCHSNNLMMVNIEKTGNKVILKNGSQLNHFILTVKYLLRSNNFLMIDKEGIFVKILNLNNLPKLMANNPLDIINDFNNQIINCMDPNSYLVINNQIVMNLGLISNYDSRVVISVGTFKNAEIAKSAYDFMTSKFESNTFYL